MCGGSPRHGWRELFSPPFTFWGGHLLVHFWFISSVHFFTYFGFSWSRLRFFCHEGERRHFAARYLMMTIYGCMYFRPPYLFNTTQIRLLDTVSMGGQMHVKRTGDAILPVSPIHPPSWMRTPCIYLGAVLAVEVDRCCRITASYSISACVLHPSNAVPWLSRHLHRRRRGTCLKFRGSQYSSRGAVN